MLDYCDNGMFLITKFPATQLTHDPPRSLQALRRSHITFIISIEHLCLSLEISVPVSVFVSRVQARTRAPTARKRVWGFNIGQVTLTSDVLASLESCLQLQLLRAVPSWKDRIVGANQAERGFPSVKCTARVYSDRGVQIVTNKKGQARLASAKDKLLVSGDNSSWETSWCLGMLPEVPFRGLR